jgi:putative peptidoglycan lipid II flippase
MSGRHTEAAVLPHDPVRPRARPRSVLVETSGLVALSVLSPMMGLAVEMALAWRFGTSAVVDAYRVTVLLVIFVQQLFVTSIFPFVIVPIFAECRAQQKERDAWTAADFLGRLFLALGVLLALLLFLFPGHATYLLAPGLVGDGRSTAIFFMRWCGLAIIPLCWSGVACGILYAHGVFRVAPLSQLMANAILLLAVLVGGAKVGSVSVVIGVVGSAIGSASLFAVRLAVVRRRFAPGRRTKSIDFPILRKLLRLAVPLLGGIIVVQMSSAVVARSLSRLAAGSLASFGYSWKLGQIVQLAPSALSTVLFPRLSEAWHSIGQGNFTVSYVRAVRVLFFITMPLTCVAYALRGQIVAFLLQRGAFSAPAGVLTATLFGILILGAPGGALATYLDRTFYATQETVLPVVVDSVLAVAAIVVVPVMATRFGVKGVALIYTLIPWVTCVALLGLFHHRHPGLQFRALGGFAFQIAAVAMASAWLGAWVGGISTHLTDYSVFSLALSLVSGTVLAGSLFLATTLLLGLPEAVEIWGYLRQCTGFRQGPC